MDIIKSLKEQVVDRLTEIHGEPLQIGCNLTSGRQIRYIMQSHAHTYLGSAYVCDRCETLERLTISYQGRGRTDLVDVGKTERGDFNIGEMP